MPHSYRFAVLLLAIATLFFFDATAGAQELAPRVFWPAPKGSNFLIVGYQYSTGDVVIDPTLPVTGVESTNNYLQVTYRRTLSLFGRTANLQFDVPYAWGESAGVFDEMPVRREISALADTRILLSVNLRGAPSMDAAGFQALRANPETIIGASILVQPPTGGYESDKIINVGTNRWATKIAIGAIWPLHPQWHLEVDAGIWLFADNDDFLGKTRQQDPIISSEIHLVRRFKPGFWAALDLNYYSGGRTTINQQISTDLQKNSRAGVTLVMPVKGRNALRFYYSTGVVIDSGGDFDIFGISFGHAF